MGTHYHKKRPRRFCRVLRGSNSRLTRALLMPTEGGMRVPARTRDANGGDGTKQGRYTWREKGERYLAHMKWNRRSAIGTYHGLEDSAGRFGVIGWMH
jgi:hypothetical protein